MAIDTDRVERAVRELLIGIGEDPTREGLRDTPKRVAQMYEEIAGGTDEDVIRVLSTQFEEDHQEMVIVRDVPFYSMCEHHLLPFYGTANIGYIPGTRIIGLNRVSQALDILARRPQLQERLTTQMADALLDSTSLDIDASAISGRAYLFRASGSVLKFPGFRVLYLEDRDDPSGEEEQGTLPNLKEGDPLHCLGIDPRQHFTQPPPRYSEPTLIKAMEEQGIGRPSTYAPTIGPIVDRNYVEKEQNRLSPTMLGTTVSELLTEYFTDIMDLDFTARMEEELDEVSTGEREWVPMLREFYGPFEKALDAAQENMPRVRLEEETDEICENCGQPMVIKTGRFGRFLACTGFPECRPSWPLLKKTGTVKREALYWHYPNYIGARHPGGARPCSVIRQGDWKLIESFENNRLELFNLKDDLGEQVDLAAKMPAKAKALQRQLAAWRAKAKVQMPKRNSAYQPPTD